MTSDVASGVSRTPPAIAYRIVTIGSGEEEWCEDAAAADAAAARRLGMTAEQIQPLRRSINVDPVVVRRDDARWRSRLVWNYRSGSAAVRVFEMLRIDETLYDH